MPDLLPPTADRAWQAANLAALHQRLDALRRRKDGTLCTEMSGLHFLVVTKEGTSLRFWLMEQSKPSTGVIQSEIDLDAPLALVEPYTQAMLLALLWCPNPTAVYLAGFGGGRIPTVLHHAYPAATIISTDIDPAVIHIAERYFGVRQDERLQVIIQDGRTYLAEHDTRFDLILLDAFLDNGYTPYRLATVEFFRLCRARLRPGGVVVLNILPGDDHAAAKAAALASVFPAVVEFTLEHENTILFGADELSVDTNALTARAAWLARQVGLAFPYAEHVQRLRPWTSHADVAPLTDAAPPLDHAAKLPSFAAPFSRVQEHLPCPCGSGLRYGDCHGSPA